ncbi:hypothetical protein [Gordonia spumicola]|uniref:hypothetical protein n=1 Tax=Gordonia spumicola TaxID=589161 RepID=UPI001E444F37|nr:hypothetical protein [Gordonia spumicola]
MRSKSLTTALATATGILAVVVAVAVTVVVLDRDDAPVASPATATTVVTHTPTTVTSTAPAQVPTIETPVIQTPVIETPTGSFVTEGGECYPSEVRSFGTDGAGRSLVCASMGSAAPPRWVQHADDDGSVHNVGDSCDDSVDSVAQDPSGLAILCSNGAWQSGP